MQENWREHQMRCVIIFSVMLFFLSWIDVLVKVFLVWLQYIWISIISVKIYFRNIILFLKTIFNFAESLFQTHHHFLKDIFKCFNSVLWRIFSHALICVRRTFLWRKIITIIILENQLQIDICYDEIFTKLDRKSIVFRFCWFCNVCYLQLLTLTTFTLIISIVISK